jgi:hypothetical protein
MIERYYCGNGDGMFNDKKGSYILYSDHMKAIKKLKHGGKRKGAGRKKKEPTKLMRIPLSKVAAVLATIGKA